MNSISGYLAPAIIYSAVFILNLILPGRWVKGYVTAKGSDEKLKYHLNGFYVFVVILLIWLLSGYFTVIPYDWLYVHRWEGVAGSCVLGLMFSLAVVVPFPKVKSSFPADLFLGRAENMQLFNGRVDAKMWLYLAGAIMLELNILSFTAHHFLLFGNISSPGVFISATLMTFFVIDYLIFEEVHLYTYDLFAERVGFKLGWGCLVFYGYFYAVFLWSTAESPDPHTPGWLLLIYPIIFFCGWILSRGANLQKFYFKSKPDQLFFWITPEAITDGRKALLVNGFWGLSRHINYLGEILMASGMILCTGYPKLIWPWLYPLYYVFLLVTRQIDDDRRCHAKYGTLWENYVKKVPYRIIPYIY